MILGAFTLAKLHSPVAKARQNIRVARVQNHIPSRGVTDTASRLDECIWIIEISAEGVWVLAIGLISCVEDSQLCRMIRPDPQYF
jgi:hypothetical protein